MTGPTARSTGAFLEGCLAQGVLSLDRLQPLEPESSAGLCRGRVRVRRVTSRGRAGITVGIIVGASCSLTRH